MNNDRKRKKISFMKAAVILLFAAITALISAVTCRTVMKAVYPLKYSEQVEKYSKEYGVDKNLIYAVIKTESSFDPSAKSDVGAVGLMQIMPETLEWISFKLGENISEEELLNEDVSIRCGTFMLKYLTDEFADTRTALAAYHAGRGKVNEWLSDKNISSNGVTLDKIPYRDTAYYVNKVTRAERIYNNLYK
ncbi:MAG: lytic transglycosylase domain-containing protein [Clostridiales bacterium]|nr:lytic transglycosylase domain-containing protein [Clostridiales bacterium]